MTIDKDTIFDAWFGEDAQVESVSIKLATVTELRDGKAIIRFDEDSQPGQKSYKCFKSYNPAVGDRVMLIKGVIIGGWVI